MTTNEPTGPIISYHADLPGFIVNGVKIGRHWHVQATRDGDRPITGVGRTYEDALAAVKRSYNARDAWPLGPERLDPHRHEVRGYFADRLAAGDKPDTAEPEYGTLPDVGDAKMRVRAHKLSCRPFVVGTVMSDIDRAIARAKAERDKAFRAAGKWIGARWLELLVAGAITAVAFVLHWEWPR